MGRTWTASRSTCSAAAKSLGQRKDKDGVGPLITKFEGKTEVPS